MSDFIPWLRGLAEKGGKGVVNNIDARSLGRIADELERLRYDRRILWMIVKSNGGYILEYGDMQDYPGDRRAIFSRADDPTSGSVTFDAVVAPIRDLVGNSLPSTSQVSLQNGKTP